MALTLEQQRSLSLARARAAAAAAATPPVEEEAKATPGFMVQAFGDNMFGRAMDTFNDATTGAGQGATFGTTDEFNAGADALARSAVTDQTNTYDTALAKQRDILHSAQERSPVATTVGEIAGGAVVMPMGAARAPVSLGRGMLEGARDTGIYSGIYGFGTGEGTENRLAGGAIGSVTGGMFGAGIPLVAAGAKTVATPFMNKLRAYLNPDAEAARQGVLALQADHALGDAAMSPQDYATAVSQGLPVMNADIGGAHTRELARNAANLSPAADTILNRSITPRIEGQGARTRGYLRGQVGGTNAFNTREGLQEAGRRELADLYAPAMEAGDRPLWSPEMQRLSTSPEVLKAMKSAVETSKSRAVNEGLGGFNAGVDISDTGVITFAKGRNGAPAYPNLRYWDQVKRDLDTAANVAARTGDGEAATRLRGQARLLRTELDRMVPEYNQPRLRAMEYFGMHGPDGALQAGQDFVNRSVDYNQASAQMRHFTPAQRELFAQGFTDSIIKKVEQTGDRFTIVPKLMGDSDMRTRIRMALGPRRALQLEARLRAEAAMDLLRPAVRGNSTTIKQWLATLAGGTGMASIDNMLEGHHPASLTNPTGLFLGALTAASHRGSIQLNRKVAERVARLLTSSDPRMFQQGVELAARNPTIMSALRHLGTVGARIAGQQAGGGYGQ